MTMDFDLVLYGATGATGREAAAYLAAHAPSTLRWAVAGRDRLGLEKLRLRVPSIVADAGDDAQLDALAARARVILTMAGPFRRYGDPLVAACLRQDTHYCDISGETARIRDLIDRHHGDATARQIKIVPFCGASSLPADLAVHLLADALGGSRLTVKAGVRLQGGRFGAGTIASIGEAIESGDDKRETDPFLLGPDDRLPEEMERDPRGVRYDHELSAWTIFSPLGISDTRAVRRSAVLSDRRIVFQEYLAFDGAPAAFATWSALRGFRTALRWRGIRALLGRFSGGADTTENTQEASYDLRLLARSDAGRSMAAHVHGAGDAGNRITVICACESALALALDGSRLPSAFGVLTPSVAIDDALIDRLRVAGLGIELVEGGKNGSAIAAQ